MTIGRLVEVLLYEAVPMLVAQVVVFHRAGGVAGDGRRGAAGAAAHAADGDADVAPAADGHNDGGLIRL